MIFRIKAGNLQRGRDRGSDQPQSLVAAVYKTRKREGTILGRDIDRQMSDQRQHALGVLIKKIARHIGRQQHHLPGQRRGS